MFSANLKRGSMELLILTSLEGAMRHGYEIGKLLEYRSSGQLEFKVSTLYSILYRLEGKGWIHGRWVEKEGQRRRCYYNLTPAGEEAVAAQRTEWTAFRTMVDHIITPSPA